MWDGDASSSPRGVLRRGEDDALELTDTEVSDERSSVIRIEENVDRGGSGGALGKRPVRISRTIADSPRISL
jgi:hypothetical protein